jgi:hypothetical protein
MDWKQKYLKYKAKYLALKALKNNKQTGGTLNNVDHLSTTPTMIDTYGYTFKGGNITNQTTNYNTANYHKLAKLLADSDVNQLAGSNDSDDDMDLEVPDVLDAPEVMNNIGEDDAIHQPKDGQNFDLQNQPDKEMEIDQEGGMKKAKTNKKYFFEDSDMDLDTTTSNSDLSLMDSDSDNSNEYNL